MKPHSHVTKFRRNNGLSSLNQQMPGAPPGQLLQYDGDEHPDYICQLQSVCYDKKSIIEKTAQTSSELTSHNGEAVLWLHLQGLPSPQILEELGEKFGLHPLALEDVLKQGQRTKLEIYDQVCFVVLNDAYRDSEGTLLLSQVSMFLGKNFVISIEASESDLFEAIRQRLRSNGPIRSKSADYLFYALIDLVVDRGFPMLESFGEQLEQLEEQVLAEPTPDTRNQIHYMKRELMVLRRAWWPQRDVISTLIRDGGHHLSDNTGIYLRDCYDHSVRLIEFADTYREMLSSLLDTYLSSVSQRMNDIMKVLTIIATIFIPLTFIAGLYGMNFSTTSPWNLPELHWKFGYFYALGVMATIAMTMVVFFKRKRWL